MILFGKVQLNLCITRLKSSKNGNYRRKNAYEGRKKWVIGELHKSRFIRNAKTINYGSSISGFWYTSLYTASKKKTFIHAWNAHNEGLQLP